MSKFYVSVLFLLISLTAAGQSKSLSRKEIKEKWYAEKEQKKQQKKLQKEEEKKGDSLSYVDACTFLNEKNFVIEADQLMFKRGSMAFVDATTNFIAVSGDEATVQIASHRVVSGGFNGVGGITVEGKVSSIECRTDKKERTHFSMNVMGTGISARVEISISDGSNEAMVTVTPNFHSNRITLVGKIVPANQSRVFKGRSF